MCGDGNADPGELCPPANPSEHTVGNGATRLVIAAFDPELDIATANTSGTVSVLKGDGAGGFAAPVALGVGAGAVSIDAGDVDNDNDVDIVTLADKDRLDVLRNNGNGTFAATKSFDLGWADTRARVQLGQADGNPALDVFHADGYNTKVALGSTSNGWSISQTKSDQHTGGDVWFALTEWKFDGDGFLDYAVVSQWDANIAVAKGQGTGDFTTHGQTMACNPCEPSDVAIADLNDDGDPDVIVSFEAGIAVMIGNSDGSLESGDLYPLDGADFTAHGDLDSDGDIDLVVASSTDGTLSVFINDGTGVLADPIELDTASSSLRTAGIADFDNDGAPDIATAFSGKVLVWLMDP
jgi:hypothetical protein